MTAPYVPFYTSDFLAGTSGLTAATKGVYITLLCLMYEMEGPVNLPRGSLARRCGASNSAFKNALADLEAEGKIEISDAGIWSKTVEKHISTRQDRRRRNAKSASVRWEKTKQKQQKLDANASVTQCQPEPEPDISKITPLKPPQTSPPDKRAKRASSGRGTNLPDGWVPDQVKARTLMKELDLTAEEMNYCFHQMRDHAHAKGRKLQDWERGYSQWVRKAKRDGEIGSGSRGRKVAGGSGRRAIDDA